MKPKEREERLSVATNAAAGAMFGVGVGIVEISAEQTAAARTVAQRVLEHVDEWYERL